MNENNLRKRDIELSPEQVPAIGSLGLIALGDVGVRAWKNARKMAREKNKNAESNRKKDGKQE